MPPVKQIIESRPLWHSAIAKMTTNRTHEELTEERIQQKIRDQIEFGTLLFMPLRYKLYGNHEWKHQMS